MKALNEQTTLSSTQNGTLIEAINESDKNAKNIICQLEYLLKHVIKYILPMSNYKAQYRYELAFVDTQFLLIWFTRPHAFELLPRIRLYQFAYIVTHIIFFLYRIS